MRQAQDKNQMNEVSENQAWDLQAMGPVTNKSYHELADRPVVEQDALLQLHTNVEMLADLQGRLSFLMREVRYIMKV